VPKRTSTQRYAGFSVNRAPMEGETLSLVLVCHAGDPMQRRASAQWKGGLRDGKGTVSTGSRALNNVAYSFAMRFENEPGTNPEELVAAAHAACFSMALSNELGTVGYRPDSIETKAVLDFDKTDKGWSVKSIHLETSAKVPGADPTKFQSAAEAAKKGCPISRLLNTQITMSAKLA
jgi:lipoyl-dependent peroxiredoxin